MENNHTNISELGEFGFIKRLTEKIKLTDKDIIKGIGDDAAVVDFGNKKTVITTDTLTEGVHFDMSYTPLKHLGYKAVVVNVSDIVAMNAQPKAITVALSFSSRFPVEAIDELYEGILLAAKLYGLEVIGGDTTSSLSGLIINITAMGVADEDELVYRNGAKENDLLVVTGDLGSAYVGLQLLEREKQVFKANDKIQPDLEGNDYVLERMLKPEARLDILELLKKMEVKPTSMIDISDGLASEIFHICTQSEVGCSVYEDKLPIDPETVMTAQEFNMSPTIVALNGGEDYELLFTIKQSDFEKVKGNPHMSIIGHMTDKNAGVNLITRDNASQPLTAQGWDAFLKKEMEGKGEEE
ncbi:MAG: thiamine-phosphate kinase [Flavobacteriales bacterium]